MRASHLIECIEHDNGHSIIQNAFTKDNAVQLGVHLVRIEYGQDRHRVGGTQRASIYEAIKQRKLGLFQTKHRCQPYNHTA